MKYLAVLPVLLCLTEGVAAAGRDVVLRQAYEELHRGSLSAARARLSPVVRSDRAQPEASVLLAFVDLWQGLYFGFNATVLESLRANALEGEKRAEVLADRTERAFWRAMSQIVRLTAEELGTPSKGGSSLQSLLAVPRMMKLLHSIEADLRYAAAQEPPVLDAKVLIVILTQCGKSVSQVCLDEMWKLLNTPRWFPVEIKYLFMNFIYGLGDVNDMNARAIPIAIELHLRYRANPLFHLSLAKLGYEVGDVEEEKQRHSEIVRREKQYGGTFAAEARYFLGVMARDEGDEQAALKYLVPVLIARPLHPEYLLPWTFLRTAQAYAALGSADLANYFANEAMRSTDATDVRSAGRAVLKSIGRLR
jgi:hypothetical protein